MATGFFARLGKALSARGHTVYRINFNGGDRVFWPLSGAVDFRDDRSMWPDFLKQRLTEWRITDIILFGDCRPLHRIAIAVAASRRLPVHVFEEGYLRPNWITLELGGVNGRSSLSKDPAWYKDAAQSAPSWNGGTPVRNSFFRRSLEDVLYNVAMTALTWRFPSYRTHRPWHPFVEYASWLRRIVRAPITKKRLADAVNRIDGTTAALYLFALQLDSDYQIRQHSSYGHMAPAMEQVIGSFAREAPADALLVIKEHPLDNAMTNWRRIAYRFAAAAGVADRVVYLAGGNLEGLIARTAGVITINSTVGFLALSFGVPVIALGSAVYDLPELTFQGGLDAFWRCGSGPDPVTFDAYRRVIAARTQLNGGFFSSHGLDLAVAGAVERLEQMTFDYPRAAVSAPVADAEFEPDTAPIGVSGIQWRPFASN